MLFSYEQERIMNTFERLRAGVGLAMVIILTPPPSSWADHVSLEEVVVVGERDKRIFELAQGINVEPDSAALLRKVVGANVVSNGPLTGIAQYRGMSRFRVSTQINGATISAGGPNWMDPPLSYAPAAHLETIEVYRGISSVSAGMETIGGAIKANTWQGDFSPGPVVASGRMRAGGQSVNAGQMYSGAVVVSSDSHLLKLSGLTETADDAEFADGELLPSQYQRDRFDVGYGFRHGQHTLRIDYGRNETGDAGTAALPMDIHYIDADLVTGSWQYDGELREVTARVHTSDIAHGMTNYHLRQPPASPAMWRRNIATGDNRGAAFSMRQGGWTLGLDYHEERHNSDIDNPNNPMFFVENFDDAQRELLGLFVQQEWTTADIWMLELGLRYNRVTMDADTVNATPAMMGMPAAVALRDSFNAADRSQTDHNFDWVAKATYMMSSELSYYVGASRKSRSPAYQERYLWLPLQATAGLADGHTYTGNLDLDPEIAHELELGIDWQKQRWEFAPRIFYRKVSDYIQGTPSSNMPAVMFVQMMNTANATNNPPPLEFNNVDAVFYGADLDWRYTFNEHWSVNGIVNYVRAKRDDITDNIYRVAPPNLFLALNYEQPNWRITLEGFGYDGQNNVSATNLESRSSGYGLVNVKGSVKLAEGLRFAFGVDNIADREYADHLSGVNRVAGNPDLVRGERLPGYGRNFFARLDYNF
jgi:iron complex outermembrane recepter protein